MLTTTIQQHDVCFTSKNTISRCRVGRRKQPKLHNFSAKLLTLASYYRAPQTVSFIATSLTLSNSFPPSDRCLSTSQFLALFSLQIYCLLCVISQYQEYKAGRGQADDDSYTCVSTHLPVSRFMIELSAKTLQHSSAQSIQPARRRLITFRRTHGRRLLILNPVHNYCVWLRLAQQLYSCAVDTRPLLRCCCKVLRSVKLNSDIAWDEASLHGCFNRNPIKENNLRSVC